MQQETVSSGAGSALPDVSFRALARLATPILIANLSIMGSGTIDTVMAGHLSPEDLAAVAVGAATTVMVMITFAGTLQGLSPIAGHHFGARRYSKIGFELSQCLWLAACLAAVGMWLLGNTDWWIALGKVQGRTAELLAGYLSGSILGLPAVLFSRSFVALNAAVSRPQVTMYVSLGMLLLKAPLNWIFMYGNLGMPAMGGAGAGFAFAVDSWLALACFTGIWKFSKFYDRMRPKRFYGPDLRALAAQLRLGVPIGLSTFFEVSSFTLMAIFISRIGTIEVAAHQCVGNFTATIYTIPLSIGIATSVLVAQSLGAGSPANARLITVRSLKAATGIGAFFAMVLVLASDFVMGLYTTDPRVQTLAASLVLLGGIYHVADCAQAVSAFALRGYRVTLAPMIIYGVLLWAVGLGGGYYMSFSGEPFGGPWGPFGFWGMIAVGLVLAGIALTRLALWVSATRVRESLRTSAD